MKNKNPIALIYCRVSSERQKNEGHGLDSQEQRCRQFAQLNKLEVLKVFKDSFTGGGDFMKRPAMKELLDYIDSKPHESFVVIFDDLKRFARDVMQHWKLRTTFDKLGVTLMSPNFEFKNDSEEAWLQETISATFNEYDRRTNKRQVVQKMKARLELGYWTFGSPIGYIQTKTAEHGKLLIPKEPEASIIKEALEGYAQGRFMDKKDIADFMVSKNFRERKKVGYNTLDRILDNSIYAGFIEYSDWGVERRKGYHEALVDEETWEIVQAKLHGRKIVHTRKDTNPDFPLRGLVICKECLEPMTASWTTGRSAKYPLYRCNTKGCKYGNKSINRENFHPMFEKVLEEIKPEENLVNLAKEIDNKTPGKK